MLINRFKDTNLENKILFKHGCFAGDLIYAMAGIKAFCETHNQKAVIYQWLDQQGRLYEGAQHPYGNSMMNRYAFDMLKPLIEAQPYVESFNEWKGEKVTVDLDMLRQVKSHMPYGNIVTWLPMVFAEMRPEYWKPWIHLKKPIDAWNPYFKIVKNGETENIGADFEDCILVNRTSRYHGQWIDYFHLKKYENRLIFTGTKEEYDTFKHEWGIELPLLVVKDFYELTIAIKTCKLFIGNQSMCFAIAEALKVPRLLEVCDFAPNVHPCGEGGYYFRVPELFKYLVDKLME